MPFPDSGLVLIRGLYRADKSNAANAVPTRESWFQGITGEASGLGVNSYTILDDRGRAMPNRFLQRLRGTAPAVNLVEIMSIDEQRLRDSLATDSGCAQWRKFCGDGCEQWDMDKSFILMGRPRQLLKGNGRGQRLLWFGNGLDELSRSQFIDHYTSGHGPLVAGFAHAIGLRSYHQVPDEQQELCDRLRDLGMGSGSSPAVFAQLKMGMPPMTLSAIRERRVANTAIKADEKRHICFEKSMLLLTAS